VCATALQWPVVVAQASVGLTAKDVTQRLLRSAAPATTPWRSRLADALRAMGATAAADSALRHLERHDARWVGCGVQVVSSPRVLCMLRVNGTL
jgi:hypothetical protein